MKNAFDKLILILDTAKERISEHEHMQIETSKMGGKEEDGQSGKDFLRWENLKHGFKLMGIIQ